MLIIYCYFLVLCYKFTLHIFVSKMHVLQFCIALNPKCDKLNEVLYFLHLLINYCVMFST